MSEEENKIKTVQPNELDLYDLVRKIWKNRKIVYLSVAVFFVLGIIIIFASPKEYKSEVILVIENNNSATGMTGLLQQFGGMSGLGNLGTAISKEALTPELYPDIIKSTPFILDLLRVKVTDSKYDSTLRLFEFLDRHTRKSLGQKIIGNTLGLPGKIIGLFRSNSRGTIIQDTINRHPLKLTSQQSKLVNMLISRIKAKEGPSSSTLIIDVEMQDPYLAAQVADSVVKSLTEYITDYRTQKVKTDLKFIEKSHHESEMKYNEAQQNYAAFKDRNTNISTASAQITEQRLQAEYSLSANLYNTLSQQLEQSKLKVQEKTPVFKILEPAKVPLSKSKPKVSFVMLAMIVLGGFIGVGIILLKLNFVIRD